MARTAQRQPPMTLTEFLAWEERQESRHEYLAGEIVAMTGGTAAHNLIVQNITAALREALRGQGRRCGTFSENLKVVTANGDAAYPDVVVTCAEWSLTDTATDQPTLIVEVLSDSTERDDRGRKWFAYQGIASLRHYLLVAQDAPRVEIFSRGEDGGWRYARVEGLQEDAPLDGTDLTLPLATIYFEVLEFASDSR